MSKIDMIILKSHKNAWVVGSSLLPARNMEFIYLMNFK